MMDTYFLNACFNIFKELLFPLFLNRGANVHLFFKLANLFSFIFEILLSYFSENSLGLFLSYMLIYVCKELCFFWLGVQMYFSFLNLQIYFHLFSEFYFLILLENSLGLFLSYLLIYLCKELCFSDWGCKSNKVFYTTKFIFKKIKFLFLSLKIICITVTKRTRYCFKRGANVFKISIHTTLASIYFRCL
jgi:hypothetical protein